MEKRRTIRRSAIAGTWYPGTEAGLRRAVEGYLANVPAAEEKGELLGLIAPHAGYQYSGQVAAYAYKRLEAKAFQRVILLGPSHRAWIGDFAASNEDYYQTPLGLVELDREFINRLGESVRLGRVQDDYEHSLEIQLPFLQVMLGQFKLVPIMMGSQELRSSRLLGQALASLTNPQEDLLLASTDLSHFHDYDTAVRLDGVVLRCVERLEAEGLARELVESRAEACGAGPVLALLSAATSLGATSAQVLRYANSGDVTGGKASVVGYMAAAIYR